MSSTQELNKEAFLATKYFNTNLVHFLLPYHVIISNIASYQHHDACLFTGTISHAMCTDR